ncbi:MAG: translation initiation factor IF-3 [Candidatus Saccharimonadales bacterium]
MWQIIKERYIKEPRLNQQIKSPEIRLIDDAGEQLGVMSLKDAFDKADEEGLDLVEISPQANPPVVKMINWGKYQYEKTKQEQKARKSQKAQEMKQIRLGLKIDSHDLEVKTNQARKFMEKGHKVKFTVRFKGREIIHPELGNELLDNLAQDLEDVAVVDQKPSLSGKQLNMVIRKK